MASDTIAAVATAVAAGEGSVSIVRISGPEAETIGARSFEAPGQQVWESHRVLYGHVLAADGVERLDEVLVLVMQAPRSFTAEDVVFSVDTFLRETHARLRVSLEHVESVTAPDDTTVVFKLKNPFGPFMGVFEVGTMPIVPKHIYEGTDFANNPANNTPIGHRPLQVRGVGKGQLHPPRKERGLLPRRPALPG